MVSADGVLLLVCISQFLLQNTITSVLQIVEWSQRSLNDLFRPMQWVYITAKKENKIFQVSMVVYSLLENISTLGNIV